MPSASLASIMLAASRAQHRADETHHGHQAGEEGTVSGEDRQKVLWPAMRGLEGHPDTPEESNPPSDHCRKAAMRKEMITQASSLIPKETFRYQVKFLALSVTQMKVLPQPCPLLAPRRGHWNSPSLPPL